MSIWRRTQKVAQQCPVITPYSHISIKHTIGEASPMKISRMRVRKLKRKRRKEVGSYI